MSFYHTGKYDSWLLHCNERDVMFKALHQRKREWIDSDPIRIIDIGSGTGAAALRLFAILDAEEITFAYTGIEPAQRMIDQFPLRRETRIIISTHEDITAALDELCIEYRCQNYETTLNIAPCKKTGNPMEKTLSAFSWNASNSTRKTRQAYVNTCKHYPIRSSTTWESSSRRALRDC